MNPGDWIALIGIIATIIINILSSVSDNKKTRHSNKLTRESIKVMQQNNIRILNQERKEEGMLAISKFQKIWPKFKLLWNLMNKGPLNRKNALKFSRIMGFYKSWSMYLETNIADSKIIKHGLQMSKVRTIRTAYAIVDMSHQGK